MTKRPITAKIHNGIDEIAIRFSSTKNAELNAHYTPELYNAYLDYLQKARHTLVHNFENLDPEMGEILLSLLLKAKGNTIEDLNIIIHQFRVEKGLIINETRPITRRVMG